MPGAGLHGRAGHDPEWGKSLHYFPGLPSVPVPFRRVC